jgi:hypothetical protein
VDFGGIIASYNVGHSNYLDLQYLFNIGPSALPALRAYRDKVGNEALMPYQISKIQALYEELWANEGDWRASTYRKHRLRQLVGRELPSVSADAP